MRNPGEIILARHGRPLLKDVSRITGPEIGAWVRRYDECGINPDFPPPDALRQLAASAGCILSSDLPRSRESASCLSDTAVVDAHLREAGLPHRISIPIRLHPGICVVLARVSWWMNWSTAAETIADTRARARHVTDRLCKRAHEHGTILERSANLLNL